MTKQELEKKLERQFESCEISDEEAEMEWQDWMHRDEVWSEW